MVLRFGWRVVGSFCGLGRVIWFVVWLFVWLWLGLAAGGPAVVFVGVDDWVVGVCVGVAFKPDVGDDFHGGYFRIWFVVVVVVVTAMVVRIVSSVFIFVVF